MRSVFCVVLSVSLAAAPALAQPAPVAPGPPGPEGHSSWLVGPHFALGGTILSVGEDRSDPGIALELGFGVRLDPRIALNLSFMWGFTEFERTEKLAGVGTDLGGATVDGYEAVSEWAKGCSDKNKSWCYMGALFAYAGLLFGFFGAGVLYALSPFASTGYVGVNGTASYLLGKEDDGLRFELGATSAVLFPQEYDDPISAVGPTAAVSFHKGHVYIGGRVSWFPTAVRITGARDRSALIGMLVAGSEL